MISTLENKVISFTPTMRNLLLRSLFVKTSNCTITESSEFIKLLSISIVFTTYQV